MASNPRNRRPSGRKPAPPPQESEDELSVELPEGEATFAEDEGYQPNEASGSHESPHEPGSPEAPVQEPSGAARRISGTRRTGRSSRRMAATSDKRPSRRQISPEERAARRRSLMTALKLALGLVILVGGGFALWWFAIRDDPQTAQGKKDISDIMNQDIPRAQSAIKNQKPDDAESALTVAEHRIDHISTLQRQELARTVEDLKAQIADLHTQITKVKHDLAVQANLAAVLDQFAHLTDPATDLDKLETAAKAFLDNPVDWPNGAHSEDFISTYAAEVNRIAVRMATIEEERTRRKLNETTVPIENAQKEAKNEIAAGKYQAALGTIDEASRKFPNADFSQLRAWVQDDAKKTWESTKEQVVKVYYADYEAIGSSSATKKDALDKARAKLHWVIDNFGIDDYVNEAKQLLAKYPE